MKRVVKNNNSRIVTDGLKYVVNGDNTKLRTYLLEEQKGFCVYTETFLGRSDKKDIDHFNPTLKGKATDNYHNWFLVKSQWNSEKSNKWIDFQPVLHPTAIDFETRIVYNDGDYILSNQNDIEAKNLMSLIKLDDVGLATERKNYINRTKIEIKDFGNAKDYFQFRVNIDINSIQFIRAIQEEFGVNVLEMI
jgi:hypothetical protein